MLSITQTQLLGGDSTLQLSCVDVARIPLLSIIQSHVVLNTLPLSVFLGCHNGESLLYLWNVELCNGELIPVTVLVHSLP